MYFNTLYFNTLYYVLICLIIDFLFEHQGHNVKICNKKYKVENSNKNKGSGVALYIQENYTYTSLEEFFKCSKNLEHLFIHVTNTTEPLFVGVLYRPPSGSKVKALTELENVLQKLPSKIVLSYEILMTIFCISGSQKCIFTILSNNMIPHISLATNFKQGCNPSLLDNVLTNSLENIKMTGVFESVFFDHHPIRISSCG